jgi:glyceraldehyde-3-phosphate dehydrogenase (NADP+)
MFDNIAENNLYKNLYNGQWINSINRDYCNLFSPITKSIYARIQTPSLKEINTSIENIKEKQNDWEQITIIEKIKILQKTLDLLIEYAELLASVLRYESGRTTKSCITELEIAADSLKVIIDCAYKIYYKDRSNLNVNANNSISFKRRLPHGVVLLMIYNRYPFSSATAAIASSLLTGNAILVKPSIPNTSSTLHLIEIFNTAGIPFGIMNTITGNSDNIDNYLVSHSKINFIGFIGNKVYGKHIAAISSLLPLWANFDTKPMKLNICYSLSIIDNLSRNSL